MALIKALVSLHVRHILIGGRDNSELEQTVFTIAQGRRGSMTIDLAIQKINGIVPDDDSFKAEFATASITRRVSAAYVLKELEHSSRLTKELKVPTPDLVHVEHIYPQTPKKGQKWRTTTIGSNGSLTSRRSLRPSTVHSQNSGFAKKKPEYAKSDLLTTKPRLPHITPAFPGAHNAFEALQP